MYILTSSVLCQTSAPTPDGNSNLISLRNMGSFFNSLHANLEENKNIVHHCFSRQTYLNTPVKVSNTAADGFVISVISSLSCLLYMSTIGQLEKQWEASTQFFSFCGSLAGGSVLFWVIRLIKDALICQRSNVLEIDYNMWVSTLFFSSPSIFH